MSDLRLPGDILDEIVDCLKDDKVTLGVVSLASHLFLHRARVHLFATLFLRSKVKDKKITLPSSRLLNIVQYAPDLASYVQEIVIHGSGYELFLSDDKALAEAIMLFERTLDNAVTPSLNHFSLIFVGWGTLPAATRVAFERLLGFRTLKIISLYQIDELPWSIFSSFAPGVTVLTFDNVLFIPPITGDSEDGWSEDGASSDILQAPYVNKDVFSRLRIEALVLNAGTLGMRPTILLADDTLCPLYLSPLRALWMTIHDENCRNQQELFSRVACSLERLGVGFVTPGIFQTGVLPPMNFGQLFKLRILHILISAKCQPRPLESAFVWLYESLKTLPRDHRLEYIVIRCVHAEAIDYQTGSWPEMKNNYEWGTVDKFLSSPRFEPLRQVHITIRATNERPYDTFAKSLPLLLPRLLEKEIITTESIISKESVVERRFNRISQNCHIQTVSDYLFDDLWTMAYSLTRFN